MHTYLPVCIHIYVYIEVAQFVAALLALFDFLKALVALVGFWPKALVALVLFRRILARSASSASILARRSRENLFDPVFGGKTLLSAEPRKFV
jgi:hypothetical protein